MDKMNKKEMTPVTHEPEDQSLQSVLSGLVPRVQLKLMALTRVWLLSIFPTSHF